MTKLERLEVKLAQVQNEIREERRKLTEQKANKFGDFKPKFSVQTGRPRISKETLIEIEIDAYRKPLPDVALKYGVSLKTLYNYGITRKALNKKIAENNLTDTPSDEG